MGITEKLTGLKITSNISGMIDRIIACGDVFYRSEQRDSPDLITQEKRALLEDLYVKDPQLFIRRYHKYLAVEDCEYFDQDDYEIQFYTKEVIERCKDVDSKKRKDVKLRNKRYAELQRLKRETDYFSNKKMREREPLLFDKMIGKFLPEEEQIHLRPTVENESLSGVFMQFEDSQIISNRRTAHLKEWNDFLRFDGEGKSKFGNLVQHASSRFCEETECVDNDEIKCADGQEEAVDGDCKPTSSSIKEEEMILESSEEDYDQDQLRADFIDHMEQRFLRGDDTEFYDYSLVDEGMTKEYEQMCDRDLEEAYFEND